MMLTVDKKYEVIINVVLAVKELYSQAICLAIRTNHMKYTKRLS